MFLCSIKCNSIQFPPFMCYFTTLKHVMEELIVRDLSVEQLKHVQVVSEDCSVSTMHTSWHHNICKEQIPKWWTKNRALKNNVGNLKGVRRGAINNYLSLAGLQIGIEKTQICISYSSSLEFCYQIFFTNVVECCTHI